MYDVDEDDDVATVDDDDVATVDDDDDHVADVIYTHYIDDDINDIGNEDDADDYDVTDVDDDIQKELFNDAISMVIVLLLINGTSVIIYDRSSTIKPTRRWKPSPKLF